MVTSSTSRAIFKGLEGTGSITFTIIQDKGGIYALGAISRTGTTTTKGRTRVALLIGKESPRRTVQSTGTTHQRLVTRA